MSEKPKGKLALYWAASCGGCEISLLAIDEKILDVAAAFDIVFWPCATDGKVHDIEKMADGEIDDLMVVATANNNHIDFWIDKADCKRRVNCVKHLIQSIDARDRGETLVFKTVE